MARVEITLLNQDVYPSVKQIAAKNGCKLILDEGNKLVYEKEHPGAFITELEMMPEIKLYIKIKVIEIPL
jgi:hypothetical protein